jgi:hypothetical protein
MAQPKTQTISIMNNTRTLEIDVANTLNFIRNRTFPLQNALAELIDNSLDAGASEISISLQRADLHIQDNGRGFTDAAAAFDIGRSSKTEGIGRYGVGLKDASIKYSDSTTIYSNGIAAHCDWDASMQSGDAPLIEIESGPTEKGSLIIWHGFMKRYRQAIQTDLIRRCYGPFLEKGNSILVNGASLTPLPFPEFTATLNETIEYEDKLVTVRGGIFRHDDPARRDWKGYHLYYNGRLIGPGRILTSGTGDVNCANFCFTVELVDGPQSRWILATNKDGVEGADELLDYIFHSLTRPMLKDAEQQHIDVELRSIIDAVESSFNETGNITRGPRTPGKGGKEGTGRGAKKKNTFSADTEGKYRGGYRGKPAKGGLQLDFQELDTDAVGEVSEGKKLIVVLNKNNAFIREHMKELAVMKAVAVLVHGFHRTVKGLDMYSEELLNNALELAGQNLMPWEGEQAA